MPGMRLCWAQGLLIIAALTACGLAPSSPTATSDPSLDLWTPGAPPDTAAPATPGPTPEMTLPAAPTAAAGYPDSSWTPPAAYAYPPAGGDLPYPAPFVPTAAPTAEVRWSVPVTEVTGAVAFEARLDDFFPTPAPQPLELACEAGALRLVRGADRVTVGRATVPACPVWQEWSPDGETAAFGLAGAEIALWRADAEAPLPVGVMDQVPSQYRHPRWSPDGQRLAFIISEAEGWPRAATVRVVEAVTQAVTEFQIGGGSDGFDLYWLGAHVVCRGDTYREPCHAAHTGQKLFEVWAGLQRLKGVVAQQHPQLSPEGRWVWLDETDLEATGAGRRYRTRYALVDAVAVQSYTLPATGENPLVFSGWSAGGDALYLIHQPRSADSLPAAGMPFGLWAFDLRTRRPDLLFEQAVRATFSPDGQRALIVFPARQPDGTLALAAGVWLAGTETMVGRTLFSPAMLYSHPEWEGGAQAFGTPAWSPDGARAAFATGLDTVLVIGADGAQFTLTADPAGEPWLRARFNWSPDGRRLLIQHHGRAWIASAPGP